MEREIIVIAHNIRSTHNVGSLFRTCEGLEVSKLILSGYTPYPTQQNDVRLPHISNKLTSQINKTALGAIELLPWEYVENPEVIINSLQNQGFVVAALEQSSSSTKLPSYAVPRKIAVILGEEVKGIPQELLQLCNLTLEIPMYGKKESFNVSVAAGMALYHFRFC